MVERIEGISTFKQKEYVAAENMAYEELVKAGYKPQGFDMKSNQGVVFKIENENHNNEKREIYRFNNWQKAAQELLR